MDFVLDNWFLFLALAVILGLLFQGPIMRFLQGVKAVNPQDALQMMNHRKATVIDVREADEYESGHIRNARHIPLNELEKRDRDLPKDKSRPIIVACRTGIRSARGAGTLKGKGYENVYNLEGGLTRWQSENLPTVKGKAASKKAS